MEIDSATGVVNDSEHGDQSVTIGVPMWVLVHVGLRVDPSDRDRRAGAAAGHRQPGRGSFGPVR